MSKRKTPAEPAGCANDASSNADDSAAESQHDPIFESREALEARVRFLRHVNHRLKNNLQVISSLLKMQAPQFESEQARNLFIAAHCRIKPMVLAYERLQTTEGIAQVDLASYLKRLLTNIATSMGAPADTVSIRAEKHVEMDLERAIPLGQILVELVSNSIRHAEAAASASVVITISLEAAADAHSSAGTCVVVARDKGAGLPSGLLPETAQTFGLKLVQMLLRQVKGSMQYRNEEGALFEIHVPIPAEHLGEAARAT